MSNTKNTFKIGLCLAGAVSAGAYTAGVIDYLIEALEEWQKRKDNNVPNTPSHHVEIPIIGGASAGGMTGIIAASALQDNIEPVRKLGQDIMAKNPNNKFYHSWVDLISDEMLNELLDTSDISKNNLLSVLNASFIDKIADRAMETSDAPSIQRKYISDRLKVFVTLSNLEGMDFSVTFKSLYKDLDRYIISSHNDYACFKLCDTESDYTNDGWIPVNFKTKTNIDPVKDAAMSTGAFPVGLKARKLSRSTKYMNDLDWFKHITKDAENPFKDAFYETVNVDGGMINNEPFDKVRELLIKETYADNSENQKNLEDMQDYAKFKCTVLMIDPFPSKPNKFNHSTKMMTIINNTLAALMSQAKIKQSGLVDAMDSKKSGQYLIAPVRYTKSKKIEGDKAIACGSLNGFSGFISKEFRIHDYFLGRANCELFLRDYFTVPADTTNEIFKNGYLNVTNLECFSSKRDKSLQIIPIFSKRESEGYMPEFSNKEKWPTVSRNEITSNRKMIKARVEKVLFNIADYSNTQRALLWIGAKFLLNGKITDAVIDKVIQSLEEHELIK